MKKSYFLGGLAVLLILTGCTSMETPGVEGLEEGEVKDLQEAVNSGSGDEVRGTLGEIAENVASRHADDVAKMEGKALPAGFPEELVYVSTGSKVTDTGGREEVDMVFMNIRIESEDELDVIVGYYKDLLNSSNNWEIETEYPGDTGTVMTLKNKAGYSQGASITIVRGKYDKLTMITIDYRDSK